MTWRAMLMVLALTGAAAAQPHPVLTDTASDKLWYAPTESGEIVYIGEEKSGIVLPIRKPVLDEGSLVLAMETDAAAVVLQSGEATLRIPLGQGGNHVLEMSADPLRPDISLNRQRLVALKGAWIRLSVLGEAQDFVVRFENGTYANLRYELTGPRARVVEEKSR